MLKVSNRKVIRNLAIRTIRANKKKNRGLIVAVMLTTILFTALFSIGVSLVKTTQRTTMRQVGGESMAGLKYCLRQDYEKLSGDPKVKNISYRIFVGSLENPELNDLSTEVYYATDDNAKEIFAFPSAGHMPEREDDIALSSLVLEKMGIPKELGQTVSLIITTGEQTYQEDFRLCGFWEGDSVSMAQMCYVSKAYQDIVAPQPVQEYSGDTNHIAGYWMIDFDFYNSYNIEGKTIALLKRNGYQPERVSYGINWAYSFSTIDFESLGIMIMLLLLILVAGYLIIYNIFFLNVSSDIQGYGLLKTIGTSGQQLKRMVKIQVLFLSAMGIPFGLIIGTIISMVLFPHIMDTMSMDRTNMVFSIHPIIYLFSGIFSWFTVEIGCRKPCKIAGEVSPIEAIHYISWKTVGKKKKIIHKVTPLWLAISNLERDRKKACVVILSLSLSIMLGNGIYAIVHSFNPDKYINRSIVGDFCIYDAALGDSSMFLEQKSVVDTDTLEYLKNMDGVEKQSNIYCNLETPVIMDLHARTMLKELKENSNDSYDMDEIDDMENKNRLFYSLYGIDDWILKQVTIYDGAIDVGNFDSGNYAIVLGYQMVASGDERVDIYQVGDRIEVELPDGVTKSYEVMAIGELPYAMTTKYYKIVGGSIIIPETEYHKHTENHGALLSILNVNQSRIEILEKEIFGFISQKDSLVYASKKTYLKEFDDYVRMFQLVGGALTIVLALIGILNFANAIITSVLKRFRELAMLEAVGMTKKQMISMLVWEGIIYGLLTTITAVLLYLLFGGPLIRLFVGDIWFFEYHFTMKLILICLPFLLLIAGTVPYLVGKMASKKSVVERMRVE